MVRPLILVTMGTNDYPFTRLEKTIADQPLYSDERCEWFVQKGNSEFSTLPACGEVQHLVPRDTMEALVKRSALIISHCGIGSLNLMLKYRKRVIFVPRVSEHGEFSDDHQLQIAREIKNKKMTVVFPEDEFPAIDYDQLCAEELISSPVDITNYELARVVNLRLTG